MRAGLKHPLGLGSTATVRMLPLRSRWRSLWREDFELKTDSSVLQASFWPEEGRGRAGLATAQAGRCAWVPRTRCGSQGWLCVYLGGWLMAGSAAHECPRSDEG